MRGYPRKAELMPRAVELRAQGLLYREIAEQLGVATKTVHSWLTDPDGSKKRARIDSYAGQCVDCGGPTSGCNGPGAAPDRCDRCNRRTQHEDAKARIIAMIRDWAAEHDGVPPSAADWNAAYAEMLGHMDRARKAREGGWPAASGVQRVFGSWNAAIEAAGFTPKAHGCYGRPGEDMRLCVEIRERYEAGESGVELAGAYDCSPQTIEYRIRKAGGQMRSHAAAQRLVVAA